MRPLKNPLFCPITVSGSDFARSASSQALARNHQRYPQNTQCIPAVARSEVLALNLRVDSPAVLRDRPCGQPDGCPIPLLCGIALELEQNLTFFKGLRLSLQNSYSGLTEKAKNGGCRPSRVNSTLGPFKAFSNEPDHSMYVKLVTS